MMQIRFAVFALVTAIACGAGPIVADDPKPTEPPKPDPVSTYTPFERHGFKIMVSWRVIHVGSVMRNLEKHLERTIKIVPDSHKPHLRAVTIWVEHDDAARQMAGAPAVAADYVPIDSAALRAWFIPSKFGGIEVFANTVLADANSDYVARYLPGWLLHEFAHAAHDQILGYGNAEVKKTFAQAMERKLYDNVAMGRLGTFSWVQPRGRAYAATNDLEYFAELSIAYFDVSTWYYPFTRADLRNHDPVGFALMESFWKSSQFTLANDMPYPVSLSWTGENSRRHKLFDLMPKQQRTFDGWSRLNLVGESMFDGEEYRFERPKAADTVWRLTAENTIKK